MVMGRKRFLLTLFAAGSVKPIETGQRYRVRLRYDHVPPKVFRCLALAALEHYTHVTIDDGEPARITLQMRAPRDGTVHVGVPRAIEGGGTETVELVELVDEPGA